MRHDVSHELRDPAGKWSVGGEAEAALRHVLQSRQRPKVQTPSQFRHPDTGHPMGKTEIGDTFEQIFRTRGAHLIEQHYGHPYVEISGAGSVAKGRTARNTPLDFRLDHKFGGELKTLNSQAANQKTAIKKEETARKRADVTRMGLNPLLVVQVVNMDQQEVSVYAFEDFASKAVSKMTKLGTYKFSRRDFRNAQIRTGHWGQRTARAATAAS